jgi:hypothetical protein
MFLLALALGMLSILLAGGGKVPDGAPLRRAQDGDERWSRESTSGRFRPALPSRYG